MGGDGGMIDGKIGLRVAADAIDAEAQFKRLLFQPFRFDQEPGHNMNREINGESLRMKSVEVQQNQSRSGSAASC
jgi:hypothetical protein